MKQNCVKLQYHLLKGSKTCKYCCYRRMWRDAILTEEQMWAAVEAILKQLEIYIASLRRDCRFILIQETLCLDLLGSGRVQGWFDNTSMIGWFLKMMNDWTRTGRCFQNFDPELNGWITWTYCILIVFISLRWLDICQMQRCWRGYLGRLRWDSATSESLISGNVCLLRRSRPGATQVK